MGRDYEDKWRAVAAYYESRTQLQTPAGCRQANTTTACTEAHEILTTVQLAAAGY